ncbi:hypothetical protein HMPREF3229_01605 [Peptoniphilus harei]|uniref:Uncharacterized protein n=1 Tax=Peptoniphilus harei TaxID=54005 RepID=A0A133PKE5_9FIRM|nr:hypothetical protein [Peptoniphilus harei]KXA28973.1 hypothetical protein HMPREF3229_01605 [Peptoniphilus harei]
MKFLGFKRILLQGGEKVAIPENEVWIARATGDIRISYKSFLDNFGNRYMYEDTVYPPGLEIKNVASSVDAMVWAKVFSSDNTIVVNLKKGESISVPRDEVWLIAKIPFTRINSQVDKLGGSYINMNGYKTLYPGAKVYSDADNIIFVAFRTKKLGGVNV